MARDTWVRTVTITTADLQTGDWESRDRNPIALAIRRVLRPGATLLVDPKEYFISHGTHREWFGLPSQLQEYAARVIHEGHADGLTVEMKFAPWAVATERSIRKGLSSGNDSVTRPSASPKQTKSPGTGIDAIFE